MGKLFLDSVKDLISVINSNLLEILLNSLSKLDLEHAYILAYAVTRGKLSMGYKDQERQLTVNSDA
jgi:hypothetical protein